MIGRLLEGMDEEQAANILDNLSEEHIENALTTGIENQLVPHLTEVRERVGEDPEPEAVRDHYESMSDQEQTEKFNRAAADLMSVLTAIRSQPVEGMEMLKERLRDPYVTEALLLIFDHEEMPDDSVADRKNYAATWIKYVGVNVIPEMYERGDAIEMIEQFHPDEDPEEILSQLGSGDDSVEE